ncbi:mediator complex subunit [Exophiala xenobiotica]|nr:mediator complex subunit [Exophiala xenobiotica]
MAVTESQKLVRYCLLRRLSLEEFAALLETYHDGIDDQQLFSALLESRLSFCAPGDPLISLYLEHVATSGIVSVSTALLVLICKWNSVKSMKTHAALHCYNQTLQDIIMVMVSPKCKVTSSDARKSLLLSSRWLASLARHVSHVDDTSIAEKTHVIEALAFLVVSMAATDGGCEALSLSNDSSANSSKDSNSVQDLRTSLRQSLELCLPLYSTISTHLIGRINTVLSVLSQNASQPGDSSTQLNDIQTLDFQANIPESHMVASKAATLLYLDVMLSTGSTIDDGALVNYLCSRHQNDYVAVFVDLFVASFQLLKMRSFSPESLSYQQTRIFLQNKLPNLLSMISASSFNGFDTEQTITDAWGQVAPQLSTRELLLIGSRFLHTCSLHHLITHTASLQLLGNEDMVSGMSKGLYTKDDLISQVVANHTRGPKLVEELVRSDGSAGFISHAVVEVERWPERRVPESMLMVLQIMHNYCHSKETQYLKDLANAIIRRPVAINCISLFVPPAFWLGPLCTLLDEWHWSEIHGEAQPLYDEFGAAFLLILVCKTRLGLAKTELGIRKRDGFLAEYFNNADSEKDLGNLSEERITHLGNWINALYLAEGLSDELFTNCSPHDFYILIPTLLRQSMIAYQQDKLTHESLKAGLDYLLEPFLLPSLASALNWIGNLLQDDVSAAAVISDVFIKPPGTPESRDIHGTILSMCASRLGKRMKSMQSHDDGKFKSVTELIKQCSEFSFSPEHSILAEHDQLSSALQQSIVVMITTAGTVSGQEQAMSTSIPATIYRAIDTIGSQGTLKVLLGVLIQLSDSQDFLFALDTVSTIVCTADCGLRDALRMQYQKLGAVLKRKDSLLAEAVVRLHRQVEVYTNLLTVQEMHLNAFTFAQQLSNIDTADPNLDGVPASAGVMDMQGDQEQADGIDQVLDEVAAMGNLDANDADMNFDALYGLQGSDMDLNDLDLDMF